VATSFVRGALLRDISARTLNGEDVSISDFRGRRDLVLIFPGPDADRLVQALRGHTDDVRSEEAVVLIAPDSARELYAAPSSAVFLTDRFGEIFFSARHPEALPDAAEVLRWLEFINAQCPE
jgi:hypothetical protein